MHNSYMLPSFFLPCLVCVLALVVSLFISCNTCVDCGLWTYIHMHTTIFLATHILVRVSVVLSIVKCAAYIVVRLLYVHCMVIQNYWKRAKEVSEPSIDKLFFPQHWCLHMDYFYDGLKIALLCVFFLLFYPRIY